MYMFKFKVRSVSDAVHVFEARACQPSAEFGASLSAEFGASLPVFDHDGALASFEEEVCVRTSY